MRSRMIAAPGTWLSATSDDRPSLTRCLILIVLTILMTAPGISRMPPLDRDESRYVQATKQMVETGDYVDIRMQDVARYNKPVGIYWLQSAAVKLSGLGDEAPIWIYRVISVLGAVGAVLALYWTGSRLFGSNAGFIAALVLAGMFSTAFEGRIAKTDAILLAFVILAQGALAQIHLAARRGVETPAHLPWVFWVAQGCGVLIKGPITLLAAGLTIVTLIALERDWRWLKRLKPLRGVLVASAIVAPWLILISLKSGGAFWQESVGKDLLAKVGQGQESHWGPPGYYFLTFSLYVWPFGLVAIASGLRAINGMRSDPRLLFCLAWYIPFWIVFEIISTKLPHYMIPAYPGLALLVGWALTTDGPAEGAAKAWQTVLRWLAGFGVIVVTLCLAAIAIGGPIYFGSGVSAWGVLAALAVLAACWFAVAPGRPMTMQRIAAATASAGVAYALLFTLVVPSFTPMWMSPRIAEAFRTSRPCETSVLASVGFHEPSMVFLTATNTVLTNAAGAADHLLADPACAVALVTATRTDAFAARLADAGRTATALTTIDGINYSSGDALSLTLYRLAP